MLNIYPKIYIKDCLSNNGIRVARLDKVSDDDYELSYFFNETLKYNLKSIEEVVEKIDGIFQSERVIMQSAINVLEIKRGNVDMTAIIQKDGSGNLGVRAFLVRMEKEECPITSIRSGSSVYTMDNFLKEFYNYSRVEISEIKNQISEFLITTFKCIEEAYGEFGEIGIDFAIDKEWKLWFVKFNAKPGKEIVHLSSDDAGVRGVFLNPLEFGKYLWKNS